MNPTPPVAGHAISANTNTIAPDKWPVFRDMLARENCAFFASEFLRGPPEPPYNGRFFAAQHHEEWADLANEAKRLCVIAARDHGKSFFWTFAYPLWMAERHPGREGFIFSASQPQAENILIRIMREVENNDRLKHLMPDKSLVGRWSAKCLEFKNKFTLHARGYGTKVRGGHPIFIVLDDILNDETAFSELVRTKEIDYFYNAVTNMIVPGGQIVVVGCVTLDSWISTAGGLRRIGSLCPGPLAPQTAYDLELGVYGRDGVRTTSKFWVNGECPTKQVALERGFRLEGSHRHPLLVMGEDGQADYRRSDELEVGDYVGVQVGAESWGPPIDLRDFKKQPRGRDWQRNEIDLPNTVTPDLAYLLGLWTAEGSFETTGRVSISNKDEPIRAWLLTHPFGLRFEANTTEGSEQTLRCSAKTFLELVEWLGGKLALAPEKVVPERIMGGDRRATTAFLQGYFDGDGNVDVTRRENASESVSQQVSAGSTSEALARDVQQLLLNLGILSSLDVRPMQASALVQNPKHDLWVVRVCAGDAYRFMTEVGFRLPRKQAVIAEMKPLTRVIAVPHQGALIARMRKEKPDHRRGRQLGVLAIKPPSVGISQIAQQQCPSVERLATTLAWFKDNGAAGPATEALHANIEEARRGRVWLPVERIEDGHAFTVDFVIPDGHSFVSNGVVSHNTPFHHQDLYGDLKKNKSYAVREYPALRADGTALWPERYSVALLDEKRDEIKALRFAREFLCQAVVDLSSLFPYAMFKGDPVEQLSAKLGMNWKWWDEKGITRRFIGVDFALSSNIGADYTVLFVVGVDGMGNRWIIDIIRDCGLSYGEQKSKIVDAARKYRPQMIFVESNQAQKIFGDELIRETDLPIRHYVTGSEKHSLEKGLPSLRILLENRKIRIPRGDEYSVKMTDIWIEEMRSHTFSSGKVFSVGEHDDTAMAFWICDQAVRNGNFDFAFGEEEGDEAAYDEMMSEPVDDEAEWDDFIPGAVARRGHPKRINAGMVNADEVIDEEDDPRDGHGMPKRPGTRPSAQEKEWRPKDQSPMGKDIFFGFGR